MGLRYLSIVLTLFCGTNAQGWWYQPEVLTLCCGTGGGTRSGAGARDDRSDHRRGTRSTTRSRGKELWLDLSILFFVFILYTHVGIVGNIVFILFLVASQAVNVDFSLAWAGRERGARSLRHSRPCCSLPACAPIWRCVSLPVEDFSTLYPKL